MITMSNCDIIPTRNRIFISHKPLKGLGGENRVHSESGTATQHDSGI